MPRKYAKVELLSEEVFRRKAAGETNREIGESYSLTKMQIKGLVNRQNRKARLIANGYVPQPKGRPRKNPVSEEQQQNNELAKLRMQCEAADAGGAAAKFSVRSWDEVTLKYRVIERFRDKYSIVAMCRMFEVSRSGYYDWRKRQDKEAKDQWLIDLIMDCQKQCKQTYGCRRVRRWLQRRHGKTVNLKAVLRVMRKLDLLSQIRRQRPYVHYKQTIYKYPNLLQRAFEQPLPNRFWVTDITYIPTAKGMVYMCAVVDLCGKMVLAYRIGNDMTSSLVTDTIRDAGQKEKVADGLALHSDQGSQYTSQAYFDLTQAYHIQPSMSSPGCPYDNAAMENFFGTLKTECLHRMKFACRSEVEQAVAEYVQFYNFERINLKNGLTPYEIRSKTA